MLASKLKSLVLVLSVLVNILLQPLVSNQHTTLQMFWSQWVTVFVHVAISFVLVAQRQVTFRFFVTLNNYLRESSFGIEVVEKIAFLTLSSIFHSFTHFLAPLPARYTQSTLQSSKIPNITKFHYQMSLCTARMGIG